MPKAQKVEFDKLIVVAELMITEAVVTASDPSTDSRVPFEYENPLAVRIGQPGCPQSGAYHNGTGEPHPEIDAAVARKPEKGEDCRLGPQVAIPPLTSVWSLAHWQSEMYGGNKLKPHNPECRTQSDAAGYGTRTHSEQVGAEL